MHEHEEEHVVVTSQGGGNGSSFPLGLIAGILIVILIVGLIWFFGFGPGVAQQSPGINVNVTVPTVAPS